MKDFLINIAEDGGTIQVGDKTYQVTLITPVEPKPVEGKWYRCVAANTTIAFTVDKWYEYSVKKYGHWLFFNDKNSESGWLVKNTPNFFDLSTPLDFDPETLVGKTLDFGEDRQYTVKQITGKTFITKHKGIECEHSIEILLNTTYKVLDPEPTLTVPDNVKFVEWQNGLSMAYNGLILGVTNENGFGLRDYDGRFSRLESLKLIPCNIDEVKNGEWVVYKFSIDDPDVYRLKTEKGWVSFNESDEYPILIQPKLSDSDDWLKVV